MIVPREGVRDLGVERARPRRGREVAPLRAPHRVAAGCGRGCRCPSTSTPSSRSGASARPRARCSAGGRRASMLSCTTGTSAAGRRCSSTDQVPWSSPQSVLERGAFRAEQPDDPARQLRHRPGRGTAPRRARAGSRRSRGWSPGARSRRVACPGTNQCAETERIASRPGQARRERAEAAAPRVVLDGVHGRAVAHEEDGHAGGGWRAHRRVPGRGGSRPVAVAAGADCPQPGRRRSLRWSRAGTAFPQGPSRHPSAAAVGRQGPVPPSWGAGGGPRAQESRPAPGRHGGTGGSRGGRVACKRLLRGSLERACRRDEGGARAGSGSGARPTGPRASLLTSGSGIGGRKNVQVALGWRRLLSSEGDATR